MDRMEKFLAAALAVYIFGTHLVFIGSGFIMVFRCMRKTPFRYLPGESIGQRDSREYQATRAVWAESPVLRKVLISSGWLALMNMIGLGVFEMVLH